MIPRTLCRGCAAAKLIATPGPASGRRRTHVIPGYMSTGPLEEETKIPRGLPLDSITERVVVPRDAKSFPIQRHQSVMSRRSQARSMIRSDSRRNRGPARNSFDFLRVQKIWWKVTFSHGRTPASGYPVNRAQRTREELINRVTTSVIYGLILLGVAFSASYFRSTRADGE